jgi:hypothetical protein
MGMDDVEGEKKRPKSEILSAAFHNAEPQLDLLILFLPLESRGKFIVSTFFVTFSWHM